MACVGVWKMILRGKRKCERTNEWTNSKSLARLANQARNGKMQCVCVGGGEGAVPREYSCVACVLVRNLDFAWFLSIV